MAFSDPPRPTVSVIIIFFNAGEFLAEAVQSVLAQTHSDWELLLVDDGSSDRSAEIARRYAAAQPAKIRCLAQKRGQNRGMSAARNLGIRQARGEYIALLDADDVWLPEKLERQLAIARAHPEAAMIYGAVQAWHSWHPENRERDSIAALRVESNALYRPPELLTSLLDAETPTTTSSLIRTRAIERVGGFEESFAGLYEDQVLFAKISAEAPIFVAAGCWYRWRKHPRSSCSIAVREGQYRAARLRFLRWLEAYLRNRGIRHREVWRSLHRELRRLRYPRAHRALFAARRSPRYALEGLKKLARRALPAPICRALKRGSASEKIAAAERSAARMPLDDDRHR